MFTESELAERLQALAARIDELAYYFDPFEYSSCFESREDGVKNALETLKSESQKEELVDWLWTVSETYTEEGAEADAILGEIAALEYWGED